MNYWKSDHIFSSVVDLRKILPLSHVLNIQLIVIHHHHRVKMQGGPCLSKKSKGVENCDCELVWHWNLGMDGRERDVLFVLMTTIALDCILFFRCNARASI